MKQIIRIEHSESGKGLFRHTDENRNIYFRSDKFKCFEDICIRHASFDNPYSESLLMSVMNDDYYCAFKSLDQFKQWILSEEIKEIIQHGFKVYLIDLEIYYEGKFQIIYKKKYIIAKKDITELFL